jgi:hypothetical protein
VCNRDFRTGAYPARNGRTGLKRSRFSASRRLGSNTEWKREALIHPGGFPNPGLDCRLAARLQTGREWQQLFNGRDLSGWQHVGDGGMRVENGLIRTYGKGMGLLWWTGGKIGNAVIRVVYRTQDKVDDSGVFIRIPLEPREAWMPVHYGYEVNIEYDPARWHEDDYYATGSLYSLTKILTKADRPGPEWNTLEISLDGPRTTVFVNGAKVTDFTEGDPVPGLRQSV